MWSTRALIPAKTLPSETMEKHSSAVKKTNFIEPPALILFLLHSLGSPETPSPAGSNETHFPASRGISADGRGFADVLVVATSEGMLNRLREEGSGVGGGPDLPQEGLGKGIIHQPVLTNHHPEPHTTDPPPAEKREYCRKEPVRPISQPQYAEYPPTAHFWATYIHGHTPHTWPTIPLCLILVVGTAGLQNGLVNAATSSHHTCWRPGTSGRCITPCPALGDPPIRQSILCSVRASVPPPCVIQDHMFPGTSEMPRNYHQAQSPPAAYQLTSFFRRCRLVKPGLYSHRLECLP